MPDEPRHSSEFAEEAGKRDAGFVSEMWYFLGNNKRWWITPIVLVLLLVSVLVLIGGSAAGPLLYPLF
jgi:hypothetical protein